MGLIVLIIEKRKFIFPFYWNNDVVIVKVHRALIFGGLWSSMLDTSEYVRTFIRSKFLCKKRSRSNNFDLHFEFGLIDLIKIEMTCWTSWNYLFIYFSNEVHIKTCSLEMSLELQYDLVNLFLQSFWANWRLCQHGVYQMSLFVIVKVEVLKHLEFIHCEKSKMFFYQPSGNKGLKNLEFHRVRWFQLSKQILIELLNGTNIMHLQYFGILHHIRFYQTFSSPIVKLWMLSDKDCIEVSSTMGKFIHEWDATWFQLNLFGSSMASMCWSKSLRWAEYLGNSGITSCCVYMLWISCCMVKLVDTVGFQGCYLNSISYKMMPADHTSTFSGSALSLP